MYFIYYYYYYYYYYYGPPDLDNIVASVSFHVVLQHLLHPVPAPGPGPQVGSHVDVVLVEMSPVEELLHGASQQAGEPAHLAEVTHVPDGFLVCWLGL